MIVRCTSLRAAFALLALGSLGLASAQDAPAANEAAKPVPNAVGNGDFSVWDGYTGQGVTTTSVGVPPKSIPEHWYGGPGVGATATYDVVAFPPGQTDVPGNPKRFLRVAWKTPPDKGWTGEGHHQGDFRFTFLENFSINDVRRFAGQTVVFSFYGRVAAGTADVVPIMWHSYDSATPGIVAVKGKGYELFESSGKPGVVAVAQGKPRAEAICRLTDRWQRFEKRLTLPATEGKSITAGHYTGVGFDVHERGAPTIDLALVDVRPLPAEPAK